MTRGTSRIRLMALVAAYALALQGLFAAWAPMALAMPGFPLCSGELADATQVPDAPVSHDRDCLSACVSIGAAAVPVPSGTPVEWHGILALRMTALATNALPVTAGGPPAARGPPAG